MSSICGAGIAGIATAHALAVARSAQHHTGRRAAAADAHQRQVDRGLSQLVARAGRRDGAVHEPAASICWSSGRTPATIDSCSIVAGMCTRRQTPRRRSSFSPKRASPSSRAQATCACIAASTMPSSISQARTPVSTIIQPAPISFSITPRFARHFPFLADDVVRRSAYAPLRLAERAATGDVPARGGARDRRHDALRPRERGRCRRWPRRRRATSHAPVARAPDFHTAISSIARDRSRNRCPHLIGVDLPLFSEMHLKVAFEDTLWRDRSQHGAGDSRRRADTRLVRRGEGRPRVERRDTLADRADAGREFICGRKDTERTRPC